MHSRFLIPFMLSSSFILWLHRLLDCYPCRDCAGTKKMGAQTHPYQGTAKHPTRNVKERPRGANFQHRFLVIKLAVLDTEQMSKVNK
jgi:hypothetical protein